MFITLACGVSIKRSWWHLLKTVDGAEVGVGVGADLTSTDRVAMLAQNLTCYNMNEISNKQCNGHKQMIISVGIIMISSNIFS